MLFDNGSGASSSSSSSGYLIDAPSSSATAGPSATSSGRNVEAIQRKQHQPMLLNVSDDVLASLLASQDSGEGLAIEWKPLPTAGTSGPDPHPVSSRWFRSRLMVRADLYPPSPFPYSPSSWARILCHSSQSPRTLAARKPSIACPPTELHHPIWSTSTQSHTASPSVQPPPPLTQSPLQLLPLQLQPRHPTTKQQRHA